MLAATSGVLGHTCSAARLTQPMKAPHCSGSTPSFASSKPSEVITSGPPALWQSSSVSRYLRPGGWRVAPGFFTSS